MLYTQDYSGSICVIFAFGSTGANPGARGGGGGGGGVLGVRNPLLGTSILHREGENRHSLFST